MKILCIGHSSWDITVPVDEYPIENTKYRYNEKYSAGGGPASNAAYLLGKWGMDTVIASTIGSDDFGTNIKKEFQDIKVNTDYIETSYEKDTSLSFILINKNNGNEPTRRDLKLIEDLLVDYKLKPGVVNVLLDYAINVNNKKLTRGFVETIAGEWQRKGIETVEDAMNNCEKVHKKSSKRNYKDDNVNMKTPDWFDKEIDKSNVSDGEENQLEELLKEYK